MKYRINIDPFYYYLWVVEPDGLIDFNDENRYHFSTEEDAIKFKNLIEKKDLRRGQEINDK